MLPNLFPTMLLFGVMGWLDFPVDIGSVMTASVALGIAVDDTLHFLLWYRRETSAGWAPVDAVRRSLSHCGPAMIHTSLIVGVGLLTYTLSGFAPTQRFAQMMIVLLAAALVGDLILLPALLLGRFGKSFQLNRVKVDGDDDKPFA
jgi:predicted RND superfamily exporter protein